MLVGSPRFSLITVIDVTSPCLSTRISSPRCCLELSPALLRFWTGGRGCPNSPGSLILPKLAYEYKRAASVKSYLPAVYGLAFRCWPLLRVFSLISIVFPVFKVFDRLLASFLISYPVSLEAWSVPWSSLKVLEIKALFIF